MRGEKVPASASRWQALHWERGVVRHVCSSRDAWRRFQYAVSVMRSGAVSLGVVVAIFHATGDASAPDASDDPEHGNPPDASGTA